VKDLNNWIVFRRFEDEQPVPYTQCTIGRYGIGDLVKLDHTVKLIVTITEILRKGFSFDKEERLLRKYARIQLTQIASLLPISYPFNKRIHSLLASCWPSL